MKEEKTMKRNIKDNDMLTNVSDFENVIRSNFGFAPITVEILETKYNSKIKTDFPTKVLIKFDKEYALKDDDDLGKDAYKNVVSKLKRYGFNTKFGTKDKVVRKGNEEDGYTYEKVRDENGNVVQEPDTTKLYLTLPTSDYPKYEKKEIIADLKNQLEADKAKKVELENTLKVVYDRTQKAQDDLDRFEEERVNTYALLSKLKTELNEIDNNSKLDEEQKKDEKEKITKKRKEDFKNADRKWSVAKSKISVLYEKQEYLEKQLRMVKSSIAKAIKDLNSYNEIKNKTAELKYGSNVLSPNEAKYIEARNKISRILGDSRKGVRYAYKRLKMQDSAYRNGASVEYTPKIKNYIKEYGRYRDYNIEGVIQNAINKLGNFDFGESSSDVNNQRIDAHKNANKQYVRNVFGVYRNPLFPASYDDQIVVAYDAKTNEIIVMNYDEFTTKSPREWGTEYEGSTTSRSGLEERRKQASDEYDKIFELAFSKDRAKLRNDYLSKNKLSTNMRDLFEEADEYLDTTYKEKLVNLKNIKNQYLNSEDEKEKNSLKKQYKDLQKQIRQDKDQIFGYHFPIIKSEKDITREGVETNYPQSEYWKGQKAEMLKKISRESGKEDYTKNRKEFFLKGLETVLTSPSKIEEFLINPGKSKAVLNNETIYNMNDFDADTLKVSPKDEAERIGILNEIKALSDELKINYSTILSGILGKIVNMGMSSNQLEIEDALKSVLSELQSKADKGSTARGVSKERLAEIDKMGENYGSKPASEMTPNELKEANQYFGLTTKGERQKQAWKGTQQPNYKFTERDSVKKLVDFAKTLKDDYLSITSAGINIRSFYKDDNGRIYIVGDGKDGKIYIGWGYDLDHGICDGGMFLEDEATYADALETLKEKYGDITFLKDDESVKKAWKEYK